MCAPPTHIFLFFLEGHLRWPDNGDKEALWAPVPICTPSGCINGLGRAPSPYGHPKGVPINAVGRAPTAYGPPKVAHYNAHPKGVHMGTQWVPIGAGNEPKASGRATKIKENKSRPIMGTLWVPIWGGCPTHPINGAGAQRASLLHMGTQRVPIEKKKKWVGACR